MATAPESNLQSVEIDYIEVDMPSAARAGCSACDDARARLDKAVALVSPVLETLGIRPAVRHLKVRSAREAELLRLWGSPTIRIGFADLHPEHRDPQDAHPEAGGEERVWVWRGQEHNQPPVEMLTEALLRMAAEPAEQHPGAYQLPPYLKRFISEPEASA